MSISKEELNKIRGFFCSELDSLCEEYPSFLQFLIFRTRNKFCDFCQLDEYEAEGWRDLEIEAGETKAVIIFNDSDWILKIPFNMQANSNKTKGKYPDYCHIEEKNYQKAVESGVEEFFAPIFRLDDYEFEDGCCSYSCPIYAMERIDVDEEENSSLGMSLSGEPEEDEYYEEPSSEELAVACLENSWGVERAIDLQDFLCDNDINDIHTGNIGVNSKGMYVICDYSGY